MDWQSPQQPVNDHGKPEPGRQEQFAEKKPTAPILEQPPLPPQPQAQPPSTPASEPSSQSSAAKKQAGSPIQGFSPLPKMKSFDTKKLKSTGQLKALPEARQEEKLEPNRPESVFTKIGGDSAPESRERQLKEELKSTQQAFAHGSAQPMFSGAQEGVMEQPAWPNTGPAEKSSTGFGNQSALSQDSVETSKSAQESIDRPGHEQVEQAAPVEGKQTDTFGRVISVEQASPPGTAPERIDEAQMPEAEPKVESKQEKQPEPIAEPPEPVVTPGNAAAEAQHDTMEGAPPDEKKLYKATKHLTTADSALDNGNYENALPLLVKAIELIQQANAKDTGVAANCHHKLGDCFYHRHDYHDALDHYTAFQEIAEKIESDIDPTAYVIVLQKMSKTYEKLARVQEARAVGRDAITAATEMLPPSHPLVTAAYRIQLTLMKKTGASPEEINELESELEVFTENQGAPTSDLEGPVEEHFKVWTGNFKLENIEKQSRIKMSRQRFQSRDSGPRLRVSKSFLQGVGITLFAVILLGILVTTGWAGYQMLKPSESDVAKSTDKRLAQFLNKEYASADGLKVLTFDTIGNATITIGKKKIKASCKVKDGGFDFWEAVSSMLGEIDEYSVTQTSQGFEDIGGTVLYAESSTDRRILDEMAHIAELAHFYYRNHQYVYPTKRSHFRALGPEIKLVNPLGAGMKPIVNYRNFETDEGDVAFSDALEEMTQGKQLFKPDSKTERFPGLIECMSVAPFDNAGQQEDGTGFLIRAFGNNGKFISASKAGSVYVLAQKNGVTIPAVKPKSLIVPFDKTKRIILKLELEED